MLYCLMVGLNGSFDLYNQEGLCVCKRGVFEEIMSDEQPLYARRTQRTRTAPAVSTLPSLQIQTPISPTFNSKCYN